MEVIFWHNQITECTIFSPKSAALFQRASTFQEELGKRSVAKHAMIQWIEVPLAHEHQVVTLFNVLDSIDLFQVELNEWLYIKAY